MTAAGALPSGEAASAAGAPSVQAPAAEPGSLGAVPVVLLDLDGTIVDSGPGILAALEHAFAQCGEPLPSAPVLRSFIGPPLETSFRDTLGLDAERSERLREAYAERYLAEGMLTAMPYPGIRELVETLTAAGRTVAVATNKPETTARRLLAHQGMAELFAEIGGADRAVGRTDKTAVIGSVLERLGISSGADARPPSAVMVGDRVHDAVGAAAHGLPAVLVGWGYGGDAERAADLPLVHSVEELAGMLSG